MSDWKNNVFFVLVEPGEPGNIGASARAIKNMGFKNLCLVNPPSADNGEGRWFARNAHDVLDSAKVYDSLFAAINDKTIVVGTTRRKGKRRGLALTADRGATKIYELAQKNKIAVLFGREARGLFNEEAGECGFMLTIPASKSQPSLNLSHAVLIIAYELSKAEHLSDGSGSADPAYILPPSRHASSPVLSRHDEISRLYERISGVLALLEYYPRGDRNLEKKILLNLRHFIGRAGLTEKELKMLLGLCYQIEKKMKS